MALWQPALSCRGSELWLSVVWVWPNPYPGLEGARALRARAGLGGMG